jgi:hypothetical protein
MEMENIPSPRIPLAVDVEFRKSYARNSTNGVLRNISLTGAFLEHKEEESSNPGDKIMLTFNVSGRIRKLLATIVWNNKAGAGIKFHPTNNRDIQIIDDLMYFVESKRSSNRGVFDNILKKVG